MSVFRIQTARASCLLRSIVIPLLVLNVSACGFYLAGTASLPPQLRSIQLLADTLDYRQKARLRQQLEQAGAVLRDNLEGDTVGLAVVIKVLPERNLVDTAGSGKTIIRLFRQLEYSLIRAAGERLAEQRTIRRQLDIEVDSDDLAGLEYQRKSAAETLDQALFGQLMFQLRHLKI